MHMGNPYIGYPGNPAINLPYGQYKAPPRTMPPNTVPFGMNPFSGHNGVSSVYPHQYLGPYPSSMMGGYGQTPPHSFSHMTGLEKTDLNSKTS